MHESFAAEAYTVASIDKTWANDLVIEHHYLHRRPSNSFCFGLWREDSGDPVGVVVFGSPASRHLQTGCCPSDPAKVIELNRLWVADPEPRNTESFFVAEALRRIPSMIVVSYADTKEGHTGIIYRALGFNYAGWTDMERKTARYDYVAPDGLHSRESFRGEGKPSWTHREQRKPKARYWTTTGTRRDRRSLSRICEWPILDWHEFPVPTEHRQLRLESRSTRGYTNGALPSSVTRPVSRRRSEGSSVIA